MLLVRLGYEIFVPHLTGALHDIGCGSWLNTRVVVDLPSVFPTLEVLLAQTTQLNVKSQKGLDFLEEKYDQPSRAVKTVNGYVSAESLALEPIVPDAVFDLLKGTKALGYHASYHGKTVQTMVRQWVVMIYSYNHLPR